MESLQLSQGERFKLTQELEIAFRAFQKNINILKKINHEAEQLFNQFKSSIEKEQSSINSILSQESYHKLVDNILSRNSSYDLDYDYATAKSIIEMSEDYTFTNKYITENEISNWMLEIKKLLDSKLIFNIPSNQKAYFAKPKEFKLENEEVKQSLASPPKQLIDNIEKNLDLTKLKIQIENRVYENKIDQIYYNKNKG